MSTHLTHKYASLADGLVHHESKAVLEAEVERAFAVEVGRDVTLPFRRLVLVAALSSTDSARCRWPLFDEVEMVDIDGDRGVIIGQDRLVAFHGA